MNDFANLKLSAEPTPNPNSMRFSSNMPISTRTGELKKGAGLIDSPLAKKLFGFPWTDAVFIGHDFITITKQDWVEWEILTEPLLGLLAEHFERGEPIWLEATSTANPQTSGSAEQAGSGDQILPGDSEVVRKIKTVIHEEIRPAVGLDGGDVEFIAFEGGVVQLKMKGACAGCPSSTYTLREGITTRLKAAVPEIMGVVAVE